MPAITPPCGAHQTQLTPSTLPTASRPRYPTRLERAGRSTLRESSSLSDVLLGGQTNPSRIPIHGVKGSDVRDSLYRLRRTRPAVGFTIPRLSKRLTSTHPLRATCAGVLRPSARGALGSLRPGSCPSPRPSRSSGLLPANRRAPLGGQKPEELDPKGSLQPPRPHNAPPPFGGVAQNTDLV